MDCRRGAFYRHQGTRLALGPRGAAKAGTGDADDGTRYGDAALAEDQDQRDKSLLLHGRDGFFKKAFSSGPVIHKVHLTRGCVASRNLWLYFAGNWV